MLIGLTGERRVGKDEVAKYFIKKYHFKNYAFANPLKKVCKELFLLNDEQLYGSKKEDIDPIWNLSPREILQKTATDVIRDNIKNIFPNISIQDGNNFWIYHFELWYQKEKNRINKNHVNVVISDVRFKNEVEAIRKYDGIIIKIKRDNLKKAYKKINSKIDNHISEMEQKEIIPDYIIYNNSTIFKLYNQIEELYKKLL